MLIEEIVEKYYRKIYAYCLAILMNRERAEDACHDVFIKAQKNIKKLDSRKNIAGWLLSTARNLCYDIYNKEKLSFPTDNLQYVLEDKSPDPEASLIEKEQIRAIAESLKNLKPTYREVLVLRDMDGFSYHEIAQYLGIEKKKVKWMLFKARKKMRLFVGEYYEKN
jgi:RNA polymerase sigma-70 factor, ECF subfamily